LRAHCATQFPKPIDDGQVYEQEVIQLNQIARVAADLAENPFV
jgi:hypothetical protein